MIDCECRCVNGVCTNYEFSFVVRRVFVFCVGGEVCCSFCCLLICL